MIFRETTLLGSYTIDLEPHSDERGWFSRVYCKNEFAQINHLKELVQINHSFNNTQGTIRGMHFQIAPFRDAKLIRCISGAILDILVDLRYDSKTYLNYFAVELSSVNRKMVYIPEGFAHGFQTLTDNTELLYHHTAFYNPNAEAGLRYDDPKLNITWRLPVSVISDKDKNYTLLDSNFKGI